MAESNLPFVSVIMPVRNEAPFVERALRSVLDSHYAAEQMEVLVVDGLSDDGTREIVRKLQREDRRVILLDNPGRIPPSALNIGVKACRGDVFVRIDGHAEIPPDFIADSIRCLREHPEAWVAGGWIETVGAGYIGRVIAGAMSSLIGVGNARFRLGNFDGYVDTLAFGAHHKWVVDRVGYFNEELPYNEDDEFNHRIRLAGGKIWMSSSIRSRYFARQSLAKLWRQYFRYGFGRIITLQSHKRVASFRQLVPLLLVSSVLVLGLLGLLWRTFWVLLGVELVLYTLALLAGTLDVARISGWSYIPLAPLVFVILHFGYGLGSLWGIVRFILLRGWGMRRVDEFKLSR